MASSARDRLLEWAKLGPADDPHHIVPLFLDAALLALEAAAEIADAHADWSASFGSGDIRGAIRALAEEIRAK